MKETFKSHDRLQEKLDSSVAKYAALKAKDELPEVRIKQVIIIGGGCIVEFEKRIRRNVSGSGTQMLRV
jgi:uncharacterized protein with ACT and thioredoxin-like domain